MSSADSIVNQIEFSYQEELEKGDSMSYINEQNDLLPVQAAPIGWCLNLLDSLPEESKDFEENSKEKIREEIHNSLKPEEFISIQIHRSMINSWFYCPECKEQYQLKYFRDYYGNALCVDCKVKVKKEQESKDYLYHNKHAIKNLTKEIQNDGNMAKKILEFLAKSENSP